MSRSYVVLFLLILGACKSGKPTVEAPVPATSETEQRPEWVRSRPVDPGYYVGVGLANKSRPDAMEAAKKNALNDLASEISVKVESNSLLYTLDRKDRFDESFTGTIKTSSNEFLEGFERAGTWENASEYWTYFRLSKAEHARIKAEKRAVAIRTALDFRLRSKQSIAAGDLRTAFDQNLRALIALKDHWGENDLVEIEGVQVPIVNAQYADLQKLTTGVHLDVLPDRCELSYAGRFKQELSISASYGEIGATRPLTQMPLFIVYPGTGGNVTELKNTDANGKARTVVQRINVSAKPLELSVKLHLDEMISRELDRTLVNALVSSLTIPGFVVPIDLTMPKVRMHATETNLGAPVGSAGVSQAVREELTSRGFRFVDRDSDADLLMDLKAATRKGTEANGFFTAYLDVSYSFRDRKTNDIVHEGGKQGVKGVQLNYEKAGLESFKKAIPEIRMDLVSGIMNAFH